MFVGKKQPCNKIFYSLISPLTLFLQSNLFKMVSSSLNSWLVTVLLGLYFTAL